MGGALRRRAPYLRTTRFQGVDALLTKKRELFPELPPTSLRSVALPRWITTSRSQKLSISVGRDRNINLFPFRYRGIQETQYLRSDKHPISAPIYRITQDRLTHGQLLFPWNPSPLRPSRFSLEYLLLPPRSAPVAAPPRLTSEASCSPQRPSYSLP